MRCLPPGHCLVPSVYTGPGWKTKQPQQCSTACRAKLLRRRTSLPPATASSVNVCLDPESQLYPDTPKSQSCTCWTVRKSTSHHEFFCGSWLANQFHLIIGDNQYGHALLHSTCIDWHGLQRLPSYPSSAIDYSTKEKDWQPLAGVHPCQQPRVLLESRFFVMQSCQTPKKAKENQLPRWWSQDTFELFKSHIKPVYHSAEPAYWPLLTIML